MQVKLDKISEWTTTGFELSNGAYQYAPINVKNHFARGKDEFVIWGSGDDGTSCGIVWIKAGQWSFIPSPSQKKSWNKPVLLDTGSDILIISGEDKKAWWVSSPEQKPCEVVSENLCAAENITEISTLGEKGGIRLFAVSTERSLPQIVLPLYIMIMRRIRCTGTSNSPLCLQMKKSGAILCNPWGGQRVSITKWILVTPIPR